MSITSVRKTVAGVVETMIKTISTTNGYNSNFTSVYVRLAVPFQESEFSINIVDATDEIESELNDLFHRHTLHFVLTIHATQSSSTGDYLCGAIQDIYKAIDGYAAMDNVKYLPIPESDDLELDQDGKITGIATVKFAVQFRTNAWGSTILD